MQREYITDEAWIKMFKFFKEHPNVYLISENKIEIFIEAIYWIMRTGAQWRMLPEKYGSWNSIFRRFKRWVDNGIWDDLMDFCIEDPDLEYVSLDSTIVRAHACSAGLGDQCKQGLGRSKGGFTSKIHSKTDALGNPLKIAITPGQESDFTQANYLLGSTRNAYVLCDKGYDSDDFRNQVIKQNNIPVIPGRSNRKIAIEYDKHIYKERSLIENFFSKIKYYRRIFSRFDKSNESFKAFISFAGALLWLK
jgi:transposase